jgi:hypothetical protein
MQAHNVVENLSSAGMSIRRNVPLDTKEAIWIILQDNARQESAGKRWFNGDYWMALL